MAIALPPNVKLALKAIDWARYAAYALLLAALLGTAYMKGRHDEQEKMLEAQIESVQTAIDNAVKWSKRTNEQERKAAEQEARQRETGGRYNEAVDKNPRAPNCDLTDDELWTFQKHVEG